MILEEKMFGDYEVDFPMDEKFVIVYGSNGTGKTKTLELLERHFLDQQKEVLFFTENRRFSVTEEEIASVMMMETLSENNIFKKYGISLQQFYPIPEVGDFIDSGFKQIVNMFCKIMLSDAPIVMIDFPEKSLHIGIRRCLLSDILALRPIEKLIIVSHCPSIIEKHRDNLVYIENIVNINAPVAYK